MIDKILVPIDGSAHALAAVDWASGLALKYRARLVLLHVIAAGNPGPFPDERLARAEAERLEIAGPDVKESAAAAITRVAEQRVRSMAVEQIRVVVEVGDPADVILDHARNLQADLIVMGRRGLGVLTGLVLGSVSSKVLHSTECACLLVH